MALYAFDGTWNEDEEAPEAETNVVRFRDIYEGPVEYREGVGTRFGLIGKALGGMFGMGGKSRIEEMYDALSRNWSNGDKTIDIIGFSRGAALAVHFANLIDQVGVKVGDGRVDKPIIRFLGVWDIVGSFGIPINFVINFQDINIGWNITHVPNCVKNCFHAMALDERRQAFDLTRLNVANDKKNVLEYWFRGVHSDIGGGNKNVARSNIALQWMLEQARNCGLPISVRSIEIVAIAANPLASIRRNFDPIPNPSRDVFATDHFHPTARPKLLSPGEKTTFPVRAADKYNWSGIRIENGGAYRFDVSSDQKWMDASIACGPDGWRSEDLPWYKEGAVKFFEDKRRCPQANWFELIGAIGNNGGGFFRIGSGGPNRIYTATQSGDLYAFANDLESKYGNNEGEIFVTISRL